ncbi:hypothetical protein EON77_00770 [bacterium]|nr:MAG: hypothetical protein EON77_00770 [bacterium]
MVRRFAPLALLTAAALILSGAATTRYRAGINPTVAGHLEYAGQAQREGRNGEATGYAKALLIGREITYAVMFDPESEPQRPEAMRALTAAAQTWRDALDDAVIIRPATEGETPNLVIHFQPDVRVDDRAISGYIQWRREIRRTGKGWEGVFEGQVFARTQYKGRPMRFEAMHCCLGHEMGHMFGLPDAASRKSGDAIMGMLNLSRPVESPNEAEVETVRNIRSDAGDIERAALAMGEQHQEILELDGTHSEGHAHAHR